MIDAHLNVDDELKSLFREEKERWPRAVKVDIDVASERLVSSATIPRGAHTPTEVFEAMDKLLVDAVPCLVLLCLEELVPDASVTDWAMVTWTPSDSPVKLRLLCSASLGTIKEELSDLSFKETYQVTGRDEVSFQAFAEKIRPRTEEDRKKAMTVEEQLHYDVLKEVKQETAAGPKMLAGMKKMEVDVQASFTEALTLLLAETSNPSAVLAKAGEKGQLEGETLQGVEGPSDLRGRLSAEQPLYVLLPASGNLVVMTWLPDNAPVKKRMLTSTFRSSVVDHIRAIATGWTVTTAEASSEEELDDSLIETASKHGDNNSMVQVDQVLPGAASPGADAGSAPPSEVVPSDTSVDRAPVPSGTDAKPPPGAVALPGMGLGAAAALKAASRSAGYAGADKPVEQTSPLFRDQEKLDTKPVFKTSMSGTVPERTGASGSTSASGADTGAPRETLSLEELQDPAKWRAMNVVASERELYLSDDVFASLFGMDKAKWAKLPNWQKERRKKEHKLY